MKAVTEEMNPLTLTWDTCSIREQLDILHQCDCQMFDALQKPETFEQILSVVTHIRSYEDGVTLVLGGSGTSGRLAYLTHCRFGTKRGVSVRYLIAGGDAAITKSAESSEDQCDVAVQDLKRVIASVQQRVLYIGISCGMSAPYVAAQLDYCQRNGISTVVLGFNPLRLARSHVIQGASFSFRDVAGKASFLVNPVLGAEPITGSSRMKGGSATLVILDSICHLASRPETPILQDVADLVSLFRSHAVYDGALLEPLVQSAGAALNAGHRVRYVASVGSAPERFAKLDASECPPTFGSAFEDVAANLEVAQGDFVIHVEQLVQVTSMFLELKLKLWLNAISTLAHIIKGKVLGNLMIDVRVSNVKLYARAISIVAHVGNTPETEAEECLLKSIYGSSKRGTTPSEHVAAAFSRQRVVPVAICLTSGVTLEQANHILDKSPKVRQALAALKHH